jgi:catechol 2,3-dioxygenase-like lactoylglutathione lyase family enzyme
MKQFLALTSVVVRDYDEAIRFYVDVLCFELVGDTYIEAQDKRWVVVAPAGSTGARLLLARAIGEEQCSRIGNQTGGRVFLFLYTDDFWRDYRVYQQKGVEFVRGPRTETYGTVAVFRDVYGNLWDLVQPNRGNGHGERDSGRSLATKGDRC